MEIRNEIRNINEPPPLDFFSLESDIFKSIYKVCPQNYSEFIKRFKKKYYLSYIIDNGKLIGLIFLDEILPQDLYYLRVIAVSQANREKGLATKMLSSLLTYTKLKDITLSFVTNTPQLFSVLSKFHSAPISKDRTKIVEQKLVEYNKKLIGQMPNSWIKNYYQLPDDSYTDGYYFLKTIKNDT